MVEYSSRFSPGGSSPLIWNSICLILRWFIPQHIVILKMILREKYCLILYDVLYIQYHPQTMRFHPSCFLTLFSMGAVKPNISMVTLITESCGLWVISGHRYYYHFLSWLPLLLVILSKNKRWSYLQNHLSIAIDSDLNIGSIDFIDYFMLPLAMGYY